MQKINFAQTIINEDGDIFSPVFNDIYFSPAGGHMESVYVFTQPNQIPLKFLIKKNVNIFEAGFGTGLNFLTTLQLFNQFAPKNSTLEYTSFELFPLKINDMKKIHGYFHYLRYESINFLKKYTDITLKKGLNKILFSNKRVILNLIIDEIKNAGKYLTGNKYDSWYLDGFSPKENPDMWSDVFFDFMASKSLNKATFSTFSSAGLIKRGLKKRGFDVKKIKGYNRKREMLCGIKL